MCRSRSELGVSSLSGCSHNPPYGSATSAQRARSRVVGGEESACSHDKPLRSVTKLARHGNGLASPSSTDSTGLHVEHVWFGSGNSQLDCLWYIVSSPCVREHLSMDSRHTRQHDCWLSNPPLVLACGVVGLVTKALVKARVRATQVHVVVDGDYRRLLRALSIIDYRRGRQGQNTAIILVLLVSMHVCNPQSRLIARVEFRAGLRHHEEGPSSPMITNLCFPSTGI